MIIPTIFYGSETGNSESLARTLSLEAIDQLPSLFINDDSKSKGLEVLPLDELINWFNNKSGLAIIICSSTGDGEPPENGLKISEYMKLDTIPIKKHEESIKFLMLGMGDKSYDDTFGLFPKTLFDFLIKSGWNALKQLEITDEDEGIELISEPWIKDLWIILKEMIGEVKSDKDIKLENESISKVLINDSGTNGCVKIESNTNNNNSFQIYNQKLNLDLSNLTSGLILTNLPKISPSVTQITYHPPSTIIKKSNDLPTIPTQLHPNLFFGNINKVTLLTSSSSIKRTLSMEIMVDNDIISYVPGDAFGFIVPNPKELVQAVIDRLNLNEYLNNQLSLLAIVGQLPTHLQPFIQTTITVNELLSYAIDLSALPKKSLLRMLSQIVTDDNEKITLEYLVSKQGSESFNQLRSQCPNLLELLNLFPSCHPSLDQLLDHLVALQPRYYSVMTSPLDKGLEFMFNVVEYLTPNQQQRYGLFTSYVNQLSNLTEQNQNIELNVKIPMFLKPHTPTSFHLPTTTKIPLILVGPGTGIAPIMSFLRHRQNQRNMTKRAGTVGRSMSDELHLKYGTIFTIFGTRNKKDSFLVGDELIKMKEDNTITQLDIVLSREPETSIKSSIYQPITATYVQHVLHHHADYIYELMIKQNGKFYLCGDAAKMAKQVNDTLTDIIRDRMDDKTGDIKLDEKKAKAILLQWTKDGKIKRDLW